MRIPQMAHTSLCPLSFGVSDCCRNASNPRDAIMQNARVLSKKYFDGYLPKAKKGTWSNNHLYKGLYLPKVRMTLTSASPANTRHIFLRRLEKDSKVSSSRQDPRKKDTK